MTSFSQESAALALLEAPVRSARDRGEGHESLAIERPARLDLFDQQPLPLHGVVKFEVKGAFGRRYVSVVAA